MSDRTLICMIGLPRSGKSTEARKLGHPIVNPDSIRVSLHGQRFFAPAEPFVWAVAHLMVDALFKAGHSHVILDACNTTHKRLDVWSKLCEENGVEFQQFFVRTGPTECIRRAMQEGDREIIPVINRMADESDLMGLAAYWGPPEEPRYYTKPKE
jgi:predicted kinase